jgi:hypothetical protein
MVSATKGSELSQTHIGSVPNVWELSQTHMGFVPKRAQPNNETQAELEEKGGSRVGSNPFRNQKWSLKKAHISQ